MIVDRQIFKQRRQRLLAQLADDTILLLPTAREKQRNGDVDFRFRPESAFYYLTGFAEPEAVLVIAPKRVEGNTILFNRPRDPQQEAWTGVRLGQENAPRQLAVDQAFSIEDFANMLPELLQGYQKIMMPLGMDSDFENHINKAISLLRSAARSGKSHPQEFIEAATILDEMRLIKDDAEIALMKEAAQISVDAHLRAMKICQPEMMEYELEAELLHEFYRNGCRAEAYSSIVAGGANACVLHYIENSAKLRDGDLVLIDAGCEYQNYASDITRTFPVNGKFSPEQKAIYELVLQAQLTAIKGIKPGKSWQSAQEAIVQVITEGLVSLGILDGKVSTLIKEQAYLPFYMHKSGHWLGLDVHDVGSYRVANQWRELQAGMLLTVEPGIYISPSAKNVDAKWLGIGVRIEDDVLVTERGYEVITDDLVKSVNDIESLMAR